MNQRHCYDFSIADLATARGEIPALAFDGAGPLHLAAAVQEALRYPGLYQQWRQLQDGEVDDASLGLTDDQAQVRARLAEDLQVDMEVITTLPMRIVRHRLGLLIGDHWQLRDVRSV